MKLVTVTKSSQSVSAAKEYMGGLGTILKTSVSLQPFQDKMFEKKLDFHIKIALEIILRDL